MDDAQIRRLMGACGIIAGALAAVGIPLYFIYSGRRRPRTSSPGSC